MNNSIDFEKANRIAAERIHEWFPGISQGRPAKDGWINECPNPTRNDRNTESFGVNPQEGIFKDFAGEQGDLVSMYAIMTGITMAESAKYFLGDMPNYREPFDMSKVMAEFGAHAPETFFVKKENITVPVTKKWFYSDGKCSFWVLRSDYQEPDGTKGKYLSQAHIDGTPGKPTKPENGYPLYNLDKILSNPTKTIVITEGEKAADAIPEPFIGTTSSGGSQNAKGSDFTVLFDRKVIFWPDNDEPGKKYFEETKKTIETKTASFSAVLPKDDWPEKSDAADFPPDFVMNELLNAKELKKKEDAFPLVAFDEMKISPPRWIIKNILEMDCSSSVFGGSGAGKSFLVLSIAAHIATKRCFCGNEIKRSGPVIYIAGEGFSGLSRRLRAWELFHKQAIPPKTIFISKSPAALGDPEFMKGVEASVRSVAEKYGNPILIIIDTWARSLVGDENSSSDVGAAIRSLSDLRREYEASCMVVHHTGLGDSSRARGSSALKASLDAEYRVENKDGILTLSNSKMKDSEPIDALTFSFESIDLGIVDEDNEAVFSCVVTPVEIANNQDIGGRASEALEIITCAGGKISRKEFDEKMKTKGISQKTVKRTRDKLIEEKRIIMSGSDIEIPKKKQEYPDEMY